MDETTHTTSGGTALVEVPQSRACTRCDDEQILVAEDRGLGKYRCGRCELVVGFDLESSPAEFLISRGLPSRYTKDLFGSRLLTVEHRLP
ncbi:MAG: hypothetical protein WDZ26_05555 [Nitriliruptoraceae bacterium]